MDSKYNKIKLYTSQSPVVIETIEKNGVSYVKREFIERKYKEVSHIFLECYDWFKNKAQAIVTKPENAEYPVWAFTESKYAGNYDNAYLITLEVPIEEVIFFKMEDWNKILNLKYLPKDNKDEERFNKKLEVYNIKNEADIFTKPFYPHLKSEVKKSWDNLFRFDKLIKEQGLPSEPFQASLWEIKKEWILLP